ncbi:hypothetical protein D3OALGA1CA_5847 [Olavius algarvensis associated proteobacterium Delta 3]|nr:hypothetical protein D3OALGB2SA_1278 [Olavius algarvensis associated proteobacterium Delta 3]CAB5172606.1 hypothetical protein D3OALGA1CA_5847 [Olavius algarvensis associated proteobacterium Delta 3]
MFNKFRENCPVSVFLILLLCLFTFPFLAGIVPIVRFPSEQIDIDVFPEFIVVKGAYVYENPFPFPVTQGFTIPFHQDPQHPPPVHISATVVSPSIQPVRIRHIFGKHRFEVTFSPYEQKVVEVSYRQAAPSKCGYYLLRTTKPWRRPLSKGDYRLMLKGVDLVDSNYPVSQVGHHVFSFSRTDFMPEIDWQWKWRVKQDEKNT